MPQLNLFATPVALHDLPGLDGVNAEITERLVVESQTAPSVYRSNVGSWHSGNLAARPEACFRRLFESIVGSVRETVETLANEHKQPLPHMRIGLHAWAMVMRQGNYTVPHHHSDAHWSTVYYADAGDADEKAVPSSGILAFIDPRQGVRSMPGLEYVGTTFTVLPRTGRLVVFPAWLLHYVHSYLGERPRVSISCNLVFEVTSPPAPSRQIRPIGAPPYAEQPRS